MRIEVLDSTLRDGVQGEGVALSNDDRQRIADLLAGVGIPLIEAGNPASNPKELRFFQHNRGSGRLCAFGSTCRKGLNPERDPAVRSLLASGAETVAIFGKCWRFHVDEILRTTPEENLRMIHDTVALFVQAGRRVIFDGEHFFDGWAQDPDYALAALNAAARAGAAVLCLCDTNGGALPERVRAGTAAAVSAYPGQTVGIHCHDDMGLAVACTMAAVEAGARHVQGTFLGVGERCGNARLSTLIPNLQLKLGYEVIPAACLGRLTTTARQLAEVLNLALPGNLPYVGRSAFAHKGGMHVDAVMKDPRSFEHLPPEAVGNRRRVLIGEVSGRAALLHQLEAALPGEVDKDSPEAKRFLEALKRKEMEGYQYEAAQASLELLLRRVLGQYKPSFAINYFRTIGEQASQGHQHTATAIISIRVGEREEITAAEGFGPVNALDLALRRALTVFYPEVAGMRLTDYKVRVIEGNDSTAAKVRVLIESTDGESRWTTVGVSHDIIEASLTALTDSIEYRLGGA